MGETSWKLRKLSSFSISHKSVRGAPFPENSGNLGRLFGSSHQFFSLIAGGAFNEHSGQSHTGSRGMLR